MAPPGTEMTRRRLYPQNHTNEEGARVTCRGTPHLLPQIHAGNDSTGLTLRRCSHGTSSAAAASPLPDNDDMLWEILLRLPPQPSSLLRVSAVCRRWRRIVADPKFMRQFYAHHRKPPIIGIFKCIYKEGIVFTPTLDPPDRITPQRLSLGRYSGCGDYGLLDCRHGLVLVKDWVRDEVAVCDPITCKQHGVSIPPEFKSPYIDGAVLCAAGDLGHIHGGCHSNPFKVVLVSKGKKDNQQLARVYSSRTGIWGNLIATEASCVLSGKPAVLVGNCLYWLSMTHDILEFDLDENNLAVISGPPVSDGTFFENWQIIHSEDGAVGYAIFCYPHFHIWQRNVNDHGIPTWVPLKTIEMHSLLKLPHTEGAMRWIQTLGYNEDNGVIFLFVDDSVYTIQLMSMQSRKLWENHRSNYYYPFTSFCTQAIHEGDEADMLHNP